MRSIATCGVAVLGVLTASAAAHAQTRDVNELLGQVRAALGGDRLAAVRTLAGSGRALRSDPGGNTVESDFELSLELPDKYRLRTAMVSMGSMSIYRNSGFNGSRVIEEIDRPPNLTGANIVIRIGGPGGVMDPDKMTPEQKAEADRQRLLMNKKDFARLMLGVFAASLPAYPLQFTDAGQAEAADGKADVIDVRGEGDFAARLFVDAATHLPLMVSWMDKEPLIIRSTGPRVPGAAGGPAKPLPPEELEKLKKDVDAQRAAAEANRRVVEHRLYYGDYRAVSGVKLPHRIQRAIAGKTTEELVFDALNVNARIDGDAFKTTK